MELFLAYRPFAAILVSLFGAMIILFTRQHPNIRESVSITTALIKFLIIVSMLPSILEQREIHLTLVSIASNISLELHVDTLGLCFAIVASFLWLLTSVYSIGYMRKGNYNNQTSYFACFAICLSATIGIAFSSNLLTFFFFYEILTISTYPLVAHNRTKEAIRAGRKYLIYTLCSGQCLLIALIWTYMISNTTTFQPGGFLQTQPMQSSWIILFALFMIGCGVKAAIVPLHVWLPDAMVAPTPVSALLHAVAVVKAGVFGVIRIIGYVFGIDLIRNLGVDKFVIGFASVTILYASIRALQETNLKRRLAYSTIGQLSYIIAGAAIGSIYSLVGAVFHLVVHAFMKITLFFCAGAIQIQTGKKDVMELKGIGRQMPLTMISFSMAVVGLVGFPFVSGFISKWYLTLGMVSSDYLWFSGILLISGLFNILYFFPIVYDSFFAKPDGYIGKSKLPWSMLFPLTITALLSFLIGIFPDFLFKFHELAFTTARYILNEFP